MVLRYVTGVLIVLVLCAAAAADAGRTEQSLNGQWESMLTQSLDALPGAGEWKPADVPGWFRSIQGEKRWFRRRFDVPKEWAGRRIYIVYDGVKYDSRHFVNGKSIGRHFRGYDRFQLDATSAVRFGATNELLVGCADWQGTFDKPVDLTDTPAGNTARSRPRKVGLTPIGGRFYDYGLWGDVKLVAVSPVHVSDVTIRTSVRKHLLSVAVEVTNAGGAAVTAEVAGRVVEAGGIRLEKKPVQLKPGERKTVSCDVPWEDAKLWTFDEPTLYHLELVVSVGGKAVDRKRTRFGFREFWCKGIYFYLNGTRLLLRSSSMWPLSPPTKQAAADHLLKMKKNINIICFRTHTQPWRQYWYDAADEVGLLMIPEGPVFNDDYFYKLEDQRFWDNYAAELRSMTQRFKNNPSVVMFSLENEFYGGRMNDKSPEKPQLVRLGEMMRSWDPTRPFMYESDGDPGGVADVIGIHYPWEMGKNYLYPNGCYWMDTPIKPTHWFTNGEALWKWSRKKPIYIGEYLWSPCPTPKRYTTFFGDEAYRDVSRCRKEAIGTAWNMQTRVYRYYRVSGLCPWTCANGSLDVTKDPMAAGQADAMRPLAAYVKEYNTRFYAGRIVKRTLHIMNDTLHGGPVKVSWEFALEDGPKQHGEMEFAMTPAELRVEDFEIKMPEVEKPSNATLTVRAGMPGAPAFEDVMPYEVHPPLWAYQPRRRVAVLGDEALAQMRKAKIEAAALPEDGTIPEGTGIVVVGRDALPAAGEGRRKVLSVRRAAGVVQGLQRFVEGGGCVLVLAQTKPHDPLGSIAFTDRRATLTFPLARRHPVLESLHGKDMKFWSPDHFVADAQVRRIDCGGQAVLVSGGDVGIEFSPLAECRLGTGVIIACGLRLLEALDDEPVAGVVLSNILEYLDEWSSDGRNCVVVPAGSDYAKTVTRLRLGVEPIPADAAVSVKTTRLVTCAGDPGAAVLDRLADGYVKPGGMLWWHRPDGKALTRLMKRLGVECSLQSGAGPVNLDFDDPFVDGLAQADLWWTGDRRRGAPGWALRPQDPSIIDCEVGMTRRVDPSKATSTSCLKMKVTGSQHNRPGEEFVVLASQGSIIGPVDFGKGGTMLVGLRGKGSPCGKIWPRVEVRIDGRAIGFVSVMSGRPETYAVAGEFAAGRHEVELRFINDASNPAAKEDRNVFISHTCVQPIDAPRDQVTSHAAPAALVSIPVGKGTILIDTIKWDEPGEHASQARGFVTSLLAKLGAHPSSFALASVEAEDMDVELVAHNKVGKTEVTLANPSSVRAKIVCDVPGRYDLRICGRGSVAAGEWPILTVKLDGTEIGQVTLDSAATSPFDLPVTLTEGEHALEMRFINDYYEAGKADRNCYLDKVEIWPGR